MVSLEEFLLGLQKEKNRREQNRKTREALEKQEKNDVKHFLYGRLVKQAANRNRRNRK